MINVQAVTKRYGYFSVLDGVNLSIAEGEFVTLVGANGAGKSTLLRMIATLLSPTSGEITIGGWSLAKHAAEIRAHIGLVSHNLMLYGDLSAAENLILFARLYGIKNIDNVVKAALDRVGLLHRQRDLVHTFSRGMAQRLALARATIHSPDVLLFDEPYSGLDQDASAWLDKFLQQEHQEGRTILMITHDLARGVAWCDRAVILNRGKIVQEVSRKEIDSAEFLSIYQAATAAKVSTAKISTSNL